MATKTHNISDAQPGSALEYGDVTDLTRLFRLRETAIYQLFREGKITGVLLRKDKRSPRGKRLFNIASVRRYLASLEASGKKAPKSNVGEMMALARRQAKKVGTK